MEIGKYVKTFLGILIGTLGVPILVSAYANQTTHPALTDEAIDLFNNYYAEQKISDEDKTLIKRGSVEEDEAPRWLNHFYDPINNKGLWGYDSSKVYAQDWPNFLIDPNVKPLSAEGQYIWQRAVYDYAYGNKNYAMLALGHILHLVEDKAVPDHTRNDAHPPIFDQESQYEKWASKFTDTNITTATDLINKNERPIILGTLDNYFDELANYSNKNFFSKDTILSKKYTEPKSSNERKIGNINFIVSTDDERLLAKKTSLIDPTTSKIKSSYSLAEETYLLPSYWSHLSPQAVMYSAGVIKLFFDEAEKEKQTGVLLSRNKSYTELATEKTKQIGNTASAVFSFLKNGFNFSTNKKVLTSSVVNIPEENVEQIIRPEIIEIKPTPAPDPKPIIVSTSASAKATARQAQAINENVLRPTQNNLETTSSSTISLVPTTKFFPVSFIQTGSNAMGYTIANPIVLNEEEEIVIETSSTTLVNTETYTPTDNVEATSTPTSTESEQAATTTTPQVPEEPVGGQAEEIIIDETLSEGSATSTPNESVGATTTPPTSTETGQAEIIPIEIPEPLSVVINEVAWAGTGATTASDEWVELYNKTNEEITLDGWILHSQTDLSPYIKLSGIIPAKSFYLIERTDDSTVNDIPADLISSFGNGLGNGGESLVLSFASTTIDQTYLCGSNNNKWPPCTDYKYYTMERRDPNKEGTEKNNWGPAISPSIIKNGKNANGENILGTPRARNSINYLINNGAQNITTDIVLKKENSPYVVNDMQLNINSGATLTIEPGVIIKFYGTSGIKVNDGKILALGTSAEKIIFTSYYDDEYGGDIDGIPLAEPWHRYGGWVGINIYASGTVLDNILLRGGGHYYNSPSYTRTALTVNNFPATLTNSTIEFSRRRGVSFSNSTSTIENNIFQNNNNPEEGEVSALAVNNGDVKILSNKFISNTTGLIVNYATGVVDGNVFENNGTNLRTYKPRVSFTNNIGIENDPPPPPPITPTLAEVGAPTENVGVIPEATTTPEEII